MRNGRPNVFIPQWFVDGVASLYLLYPSAGPMPGPTPAAWWDKFHNLPEAAVRRAFVLAPREMEETKFMPSGEFIRRIAEREAKVLTGPKPNYDLRCLSDGFDSEPPEDPYFAALWHKFRRGEIPGKDVAAKIVSKIVSASSRAA